MKPLLLLAALLPLAACQTSAHRQSQQPYRAPSAKNSPFLHRDGTRDAERDFAAGSLAVKGYGLPPSAIETYILILKKRYHVGYDVLAGCIVDEPLVRYADSYNVAASRLLKNQFGYDVLTAAWTEARARYRTTHPRDTSVSW